MKKLRVSPEQGQCGVCGKTFDKKHPWQEYCGTSCKMIAYWRRRIKREAN